MEQEAMEGQIQVDYGIYDQLWCLIFFVLQLGSQFRQQGSHTNP